MIAVCISSGLSGTWNAIRVAAEQQERVEVFVYDTKNISIACGLLGIWASYKVSQGCSFAEICQALQDKTYDSKVMFYMDSLEYGSRQGKDKLLKEMLRFCRGHKVWLGIGHGAAPDEAKRMEQMVLEELGDSGEVLYNKQIAATLALNTGPGLVGVAAILDP